jgi:hypothetical protein
MSDLDEGYLEDAPYVQAGLLRTMAREIPDRWLCKPADLLEQQAKTIRRQSEEIDHLHDEADEYRATITELRTVLEGIKDYTFNSSHPHCAWVHDYAEESLKEKTDE